MQLELLVLHAVCFATSCRAEFGRGGIEPMLLPAEGEESSWACPACIAALVRMATRGIARRVAWDAAQNVLGHALCDTWPPLGEGRARLGRGVSTVLHAFCTPSVLR